MTYFDKSISLIIPAYNEEQSIGKVITEFLTLTLADGITPLIDQIIVCDNASIDNTAELARKAGAEVVYEGKQGYGAACLTAIKALRKPDIVVFADADHSILFSEIHLLLNKIDHGADLVIGKRDASLQQKQSLTPQQRFGNILASWLIRLLWKYPVTDLGPFRAITYNSLIKLNMADEKFGWTVEMQVKAIQVGLNVQEVPVSSLKRIGKSKISGTIRGTIGAAIGIFGTIFHLYKNEKQLLLNYQKHT